MSPSDNEISCPSCLTENGPLETFCRKCGSPIGATATLDPINAIHTEGFLFRKAIEDRPKPIVLIGVWIVFFPLLVASSFSAVRLILYHASSGDFFFFWAFVALTWIALIILYRVTKNYLTLNGNSGTHDEN